MNTHRLTLIGGGVRSGKSRFALELARRVDAHPTFIATAQAHDDEMAQRIRAHQDERGDDFETLEEPLNLGGAIHRARGAKVIVIDCLTLWLSNLLLEESAKVASRLDAFEDALRRRSQPMILVSNEVGMGLVPPTELGRAFRDLSGGVHQRVSAMADELYLGVMGTLVQLRPELREVRR